MVQGFRLGVGFRDAELGCLLLAVCKMQMPRVRFMGQNQPDALNPVSKCQRSPNAYIPSPEPKPETLCATPQHQILPSYTLNPIKPKPRTVKA